MMQLKYTRHSLPLMNLFTLYQTYTLAVQVSDSIKWEFTPGLLCHAHNADKVDNRYKYVWVQKAVKFCNFGKKNYKQNPLDESF